MTSDPSRYGIHLFLLRLWREPLDQERFEWRGEVKNPENGETRYFRSADSFYDGLLAMLDTPTSDVLSPDTSQESRA